jgi:6-pyruvoyltetrahydropterin/6-carboxytetrahydropterin synthase
MKIERSIEICAAHRLLGYNGKCENLHGHNYIITLTIIGEQFKHKANTGMFIDFKTLKEYLLYLDSIWDHKVLLNSDDPLVKVMQNEQMQYYTFSHGKNPTAENMCNEAATHMERQGIFNVKEGVVSSFEISVEETLHNKATMQYSRKDFEVE